MRLSLCIPTYNRAGFLGDLFDSILAQRPYGCELEIVVSDNASTDDTAQVVERYRTRFARLVYVTAAQNMGADRNYLRCVEAASGDFCWLMGSDDVAEPDAILNIETAIRDHPDIAGLSIGRNVRTFELEQHSQQLYPRGFKGTTSSPLSGANEVFENLSVYFGYLSAQVVRRALWNEVVAQDPVEDYLNAWVHVYVIGRMLQRCPRWLYVPLPLVGWRADNDSFLSAGALNRLRIDVKGYEEVARGLFGTGSTYRHINRDVATGLVFYRLLHAKMNDAPARFYLDAATLTIGHYWRYPAFWFKSAPVFLVPRVGLLAARRTYRRWRGKEG